AVRRHPGRVGRLRTGGVAAIRVAAPVASCGEEEHVSRPPAPQPLVVRLLLDTCTFLWLAAGGGALSRRAVAGIADPANDVLFSSVSAWEIVTKHQLGKLPLPEPPDRLIAEECRA